MRESYEAVVVGAGMVGAACAAELFGGGWEILVVEGGKVGCAGAGAADY